MRVHACILECTYAGTWPRVLLRTWLRGAVHVIHGMSVHGVARVWVVHGVARAVLHEVSFMHAHVFQVCGAQVGARNLQDSEDNKEQEEQKEQVNDIV